MNKTSEHYLCWLNSFKVEGFYYEAIENSFSVMNTFWNSDFFTFPLSQWSFMTDYEDPRNLMIIFY